MWKRKDLKMKAKAAFKKNYWYCVFAALLLAIIVGSVAGSASGRGSEHVSSSETVTQMQLGISFTAVTVVFLLRTFGLNPFEVGGRKFFADNALGDAPVNGLLAGFTGNYMRNVLALFLRDLFIFLWTLLFIIPGIVKAYSYRMVPYILADHPDMDAMEAITLSRQMMNGSKWKAFVLDLSFIGWYLLTALTFGILGIFYVNPYREATHAELYLALRDGN